MRAERLGPWIAAFAMAAAAVADAQTVDDPPIGEQYQSLCSGCHGGSFRLPSGATTTRDVAELVNLIRDGIATKGMPAFGARLSAAQIQALAAFIRPAPSPSSARVGASMEAEALHPAHSANYVIMTAEGNPATQFAGFFSERSWLCFDNVDLTGVRSLELEYSKGNDDEGRFAILVGDGLRTARVNLAEKRAVPTGGWETFARHRVGLEREVSGPQLLCLYGVSGGGILNLDRLTLSAEPAEHDGLTIAFDVPQEPVITAAGYRFRLERVAEASSDLWGMAFLPDGRLLVTQKNGQVLLFRDGKRLGALDGTPAVWSGGQGGMMDVKPHPEYARNGWIYLSFSDPHPGNATSMTRVVRGKLDGLRWVQQQDVYRAPDRFYTEHYAHFGSRMAFLDGDLYFSVGERQQRDLAQDLGYPFGKIHRVRDDGRVPNDNPFIGRAGALPTIWSFGHRNPQGMTAQAGALWSSEHGPAGGDELNLVRRAANFGWPLVSFGTHYDGTAVGASPWLEGVEPPVHHWTPSIAVSQIAFYSGTAFPDWNRQLLVSSLGSSELRLLRLRGERVLNDRLLMKGHGRIRDLAVGPDGFVYLLLNRMGAGIYRLRPV
jgi:glucose/arabinose dehydrogenase/mono/diheme cytochrome c family protein